MVRKGQQQSDEAKRKIGLANKGKKLSKETKIKVSKNHAHYWKGKKLSDAHKIKISIANKGKPGWLKGKHHSEETKRKMSDSWKLGNRVSGRKGKHHTEGAKIKIGLAQKGNTHCLGYKHSSEAKRNMSEAQKGHNSHKYTESSKKKMRMSAIKRIETQHDNSLPIMPNIGKYETKILDNLEQILGYKIHRQHPIIGYFLDGYCSNLNLAIEIDEPHHNNQKEKDIERENNIKEELNCEFFRVNIL